MVLKYENTLGKNVQLRLSELNLQSSFKNTLVKKESQGPSLPSPGTI